MTWLRWQKGRQRGGYDKLLLATARRPFPFDCYLIRYPVGAFIAPHTDPVDGHRHFRLNLEVRRGTRGGVFVRNGLPQHGRIHLFRPDVERHEVTRVEGRARYVLSVGWVRPPVPADG